MKRLTLAHLAAIFACAFPCVAEETGNTIADRVQTLTAATVWKSVREVPLQFDAFHPQGMAIIDGVFYVSSVEVVDRVKGQGRGHVFKIDGEGKILADAVISTGRNYHPGGMDYDGKAIWVPSAEYWPGGRSAVIKLDPATMASSVSFWAADHIGLVVHDPVAGRFVGATWGSRTFYRWDETSIPKSPEERDPQAARAPNRSHYVDLQDGQWLRGTTWILCGGLKDYRGPKGAFALGGLEMINMATLATLFQVPVPLWEPSGLPMLQNAFYVEATEAGLRFFFLPGDGHGTIHVYVPELRGK